MAERHERAVRAIGPAVRRGREATSPLAQCGEPRRRAPQSSRPGGERCRDSDSEGGDFPRERPHGLIRCATLTAPFGASLPPAGESIGSKRRRPMQFACREHAAGARSGRRCLLRPQNRRTNTRRPQHARRNRSGYPDRRSLPGSSASASTHPYRTLRSRRFRLGRQSGDGGRFQAAASFDSLFMMIAAWPRRLSGVGRSRLK